MTLMTIEVILASLLIYAQGDASGAIMRRVSRADAPVKMNVAIHAGLLKGEPEWLVPDTSDNCQAIKFGARPLEEARIHPVTPSLDLLGTATSTYSSVPS